MVHFLAKLIPLSVRAELLYNRQQKGAVCAIHFLDESVNKHNIKVFTDHRVQCHFTKTKVVFALGGVCLQQKGAGLGLLCFAWDTRDANLQRGN